MKGTTTPRSRYASQRMNTIAAIGGLGAVVFLQKIALPLTAEGAGAQTSILVLIVPLILLACARRLLIDPVQLALYAAFVLAALLSLVVGGQPFSLASFSRALVGPAKRRRTDGVVQVRCWRI